MDNQLYIEIHKHLNMQDIRNILIASHRKMFKLLHHNQWYELTVDTLIKLKLIQGDIVQLCWESDPETDKCALSVIAAFSVRD